MTNKLNQYFSVLSQAEIQLRNLLIQNKDSQLNCLIQLQIRDIVDALTKAKDFEKSQESLQDQKENISSINTIQIEKPLQQPKEIEVINKKRTISESLNEGINDMIVKNIKIEEQSPEKDNSVPKNISPLQIMNKTSYVPLEISLPQGFEFFKDDHSSMSQLKWIPTFDFSMFQKENNCENKMKKGIDMHSFMHKFIKGEGNGIEEHIQSRYKNELSMNEIQMLLEVGKQTLKYLKLRNFTSIEAEKYIKPYRVDVLATNEEESLIIDWKSSSLERQDVIALDIDSHFLNHIKEVQKINKKRVTIMIILLQKYPIEFVEYTQEDIEKIQKDQCKNTVFQQTFIKLAKEELNQNKEKVMKRSFTEISGITQTISQYINEIKEFIEKEKGNVNTLVEFLNPENSAHYLENLSQTGETKKEILINFFIIHTMMLEYYLSIMKQQM